MNCPECGRLREQLAEARRILGATVKSADEDRAADRTALAEKDAALREALAYARADATASRQKAEAERDEARGFLAVAKAGLLEWKAQHAELHRERADLIRERNEARAALQGLESRYEPGVFCDHAAEPCDRCEAARRALSEHPPAPAPKEGK